MSGLMVSNCSGRPVALKAHEHRVIRALNGRAGIGLNQADLNMREVHDLLFSRTLESADHFGYQDARNSWTS
jgi:hypothetical protein